MPVIGSSVEQILKNEGPCLSSRLVAALEAQGVTPQAARQRVSRANGPVKRLQGLVFPRGARFFYHQSSFNSSDYWDALLRDIAEASPAYAPAMAALIARGGIVPLAHFHILSGAPILQRGQIASSTVLERLLNVRLVNQQEVAGVGPCIVLAANGTLDHDSDEVFRARLLTEKILLLAVKDWARKLGAASYNKITLRDENAEPPKVGTFRWDLAGPSYLAPMVRRQAGGKPNPGFLVCDAIVGAALDEKAITAFVRKCQLLGYLRRVPPVLPLLIADRFTREAFQLGRSHGIMMATPGTLFGREVAQGLAALLGTLSKAAAVASQNPAIIGELFDKLSGIEGAASNMRGALFEMLVGHCVQKQEDGLIDIGKSLVDPAGGKSADVDVFRVKEHREVWCYECKGHQPTEIVDLNAMEHWITDRVPVMHGALKQESRFKGSKFYYEYWTCGSFAPDAIAYLEKVSAKTKKYALGWKDGPAVRAYAAKIRPSTVLKVLDEHYFKHPIARVEKKYDGAAALREATLDMDTVVLEDDWEDLEA
jgi:hypothetical protein